MEQGAGVGQFWTPIQAISGSLLHADLQKLPVFTGAGLREATKNRKVPHTPEKKMQRLAEMLGEQMAKGAELDGLIRQKLGGMGYEF